MLDSFFKGIFDTDYTIVISLHNFLFCVGTALMIGLILTAFYMYRSRYTKSFVVTLALLPAIVCVIIMTVNGNVGTGVAVAGAFGLIRFRSVAGSAKEISAIFLAMTMGLLTGMGYLGYAFLCALLLGGIGMIYNQINFKCKNFNKYKTLRITIPEDLDYTDVFDLILKDFTTEYELIQVKTTNMGSLFRLTYDLTMAEGSNEKKLIDALRCRNGNLEITISNQEMATGEL